MLVPAASPLRSRSRLSPVTNAESTAGEGRGRFRPAAQTPVATYRCRRPPAREHGPHQVARAGGAAAIFLRVPCRASPSPPTPGSPLTCSQKELQHHRRQQLHGPGLGGGGEAATTLEAAATGRWHGSRVGGAQEILPGTFCCRPLRASLAGISAELAAAGSLCIHSVCPSARALEPQ